MSSLIFLHGASSSGKTTLARAVQARIEVPFWHWSIDHLRDAGVVPMERVRRGDFSWAEMREGFFAGFHASVGAFLRAGNNLILEHIIDGEGWHGALAELLAPHDVLFVGVHTDLDELRRREAARGDRPTGSAEADFARVHRGLRYDLELEGVDDLAANTLRLLEAWRAPRGRSAFFDSRRT